MDWITQNIESIFIGIISAFIFIFIVFFFFRPWLYISKKICKDGDVYRFKVINFTLIKCTDIDMYLRQVKEIDAYPKVKMLFMSC